MEDLNRHFPGCTLSTENLRKVIRKCIGMNNNDYFCYKCFKFLGLGIGIPKNSLLCKGCYQFYCKDCGLKYKGRNDMEIDPNICIQCVDTKRFTY